LTANRSRFATRSFSKGTTTNAFREENERERKERRESEREKEQRKEERLFRDVMKRFSSVALLVFSVKAFRLVLGEKDMSRLSSLKHALEHSFLPL